MFSQYAAIRFACSALSPRREGRRPERRGESAERRQTGWRRLSAPWPLLRKRLGLRRWTGGNQLVSQRSRAAGRNCPIRSHRLYLSSAVIARSIRPSVQPQRLERRLPDITVENRVDMLQHIRSELKHLSLVPYWQ